ncbi:GNAT family N-acetyltransferase [Metabacillus litoralis]|uniref:GNAT family N-acetyltransferase n=1 Tax=Metabacillus litoralis TaxID=152268 RepID=A0A5C6VZ21_9BACI|nr:GNAT family protein [Metabacillus litoralis]TXC89346.1 GNAT family N-acetyltransferase [Metabacillus litoralis]
MNITLKKLDLHDAQNLFTFELENRSFFEKMVPSRGDDYYQFDCFLKKHEDLLNEQKEGKSFFYLIINLNGHICGRMNIVDLDGGINTTGHLGYRVGKNYTGKGVASQALQLLLNSISEEGINEIRAKTTTNNIASQKVLEKNGFERVSTSDELFFMNGEKISFVTYRCLLKN